MSKKPQPPPPQPGDGLRSMQSTSLFRALNFELYAKPNLVVMILGGVAIVTSVTYIAYMRKKYKDMGFYRAIQPDGEEKFIKKKSKWDD